MTGGVSGWVITFGGREPLDHTREGEDRLMHVVLMVRHVVLDATFSFLAVALGCLSTMAQSVTQQ